jgi:hypothetical protein
MDKIVFDGFSSPAILGSFEGVIHGFSKEARTRGFASPLFSGFAFIA